MCYSISNINKCSYRSMGKLFPAILDHQTTRPTKQTNRPTEKLGHREDRTINIETLNKTLNKIKPICHDIFRKQPSLHHLVYR